MDELLPQLVTQDNALIEACYTMTLNEKRLLLLGMSKVNPMSFPDSDLKLSFKLTSDDWKKAFPDSGNAYRDMRKAADSMLTRYLTLHPKTGVTKKISWFDSVEYVENAASVEVVFGYSIQVRLMGMLENFTTMPLLEVGKLSSVYGVRLFELLQQFKKTGVRVISLEDFRVAMDCIDRYPETKHLKQNILKPALKDLKENNQMLVHVKDVKDGRKITGFKFTFEKQRQLF